MAGTPPTWAVAALGDEPAPLIAAFARHHLAIGAAEVHVFLDRPNPEVEKLIGDRDGVSITTCDQSYWARVNNGKRPERHTGRQKFVSTSVYNTSSCDWLLHCDVDEFIADGTALSKALGKADRTKGLVIRNAERVYLPGAPGEMLFEGGFRQPVALEEDEMQSLYGRFSKFLSQGFTGHRTGKTIVPTGQAWEMGVHYPKILADGSRPPVASTERRLLLHFDGLTPLHYAIKLLKKSFENYSGPKRKLGAAREAQYRFARNHADRPREILRLVEEVQSLDARQAESLLALDRLRLDPFVPKDCDDLDLTRATFDALLRERDGEILAKAGLVM